MAAKGEKFRAQRARDEAAKQSSARMRRLREEWEREQVERDRELQARLKGEFLARHPWGRA